MKSFKLIFIFVGILALVVGGLYFAAGGGFNINFGSSSEFEKYKKQMEDEWKGTGDWDEQLYTKWCDTFVHLNSAEQRTLMDRNTSLGLDYVKDNMMKEWEKSTCQKSVIEKYYKALGVMNSQDERAKTNSDYQTLTSIYNSYIRAYNLAHRNIGLSPSYGGGTNWTSYEAYRSGIEDELNRVKGDTNYRTYLSGISDISSGLNGIQSKLASGETTYYNSLAQKIQSYYANREATWENCRALQDARDKYVNEYGYNSGLDNFCEDYLESVYEEY